jgi:S-formylglutathione hydrolase FrmB
MRDFVRHLLRLAFIPSLLIPACRRAPLSKPDQPQLAAGVTMHDVVFRSAALGREMSYRVYLPATLPAGRKLPVVYLLHGAGDDFRSWSNQSSVARYAAQGMILVMPEGGLSYYMNAVETPQDKYADYITKDLIADVESRFPAANNREGRAIVGISMGGLAAVDYGLAQPDLFIFVGALSPAVDVPSRPFSLKRIDKWWRFRTIFGPVGSPERKARDPFELVRTASPQRTPYIYLTAGQQEPLLDPIRRFAVRLKDRGFAYEFHIMPGGHDWTEWNAQIQGCFESLLKALPAQTNQ